MSCLRGGSWSGATLLLLTHGAAAYDSVNRLYESQSDGQHGIGQPEVDDFTYSVRVFPTGYDAETMPTGLAIRVELAISGPAWNSTTEEYNRWQLLNLTAGAAGIRMIRGFVGGGSRDPNLGSQWTGTENYCRSTAQSDVIDTRDNLVDSTGNTPELEWATSGYATFTVPDEPWRLCFRKSPSHFNKTGDDQWGTTKWQSTWLTIGPEDTSFTYQWDEPATGGFVRYPNSSELFWRMRGPAMAGDFAAIEVVPSGIFADRFPLKPGATHRDAIWNLDVAKLVPLGSECIDDAYVLGGSWTYPGTYSTIISSIGGYYSGYFTEVAMGAVAGTFAPSIGVASEVPWMRNTSTSYWWPYGATPVIYIQLPDVAVETQYHLCYSSVDERKELRVPDATQQSPGWRKLSRMPGGDGLAVDLTFTVYPRDSARVVTWSAEDLTEDSWGWIRFAVPTSEPAGVLLATPSSGDYLDVLDGDQFKVVPLATYYSYPNLADTSAQSSYPFTGCWANLSTYNLGSTDLGGHPRQPYGWADDFTGQYVWGYYTVPTQPARVCYRRPGDDWRVLDTILFPQSSTVPNVTYWVNDSSAGTWAPMVLEESQALFTLKPVANLWYFPPAVVDESSVALKMVRSGGNCMTDRAAADTELWDLGPSNALITGAVSQLTAWVRLPGHDAETVSPASSAGWYVCMKQGSRNWVKLSNPKYNDNVYASTGSLVKTLYRQEYADKLRTARGPEIYGVLDDRRAGTVANLSASSYYGGGVTSYYTFSDNDRYYVAPNATNCWAAAAARAASSFVVDSQGATAVMRLAIPEVGGEYRLCYEPYLTPNIYEALFKFTDAAQVSTPALEPTSSPGIICEIHPLLAGTIANITVLSNTYNLDTDPNRDQVKVVYATGPLACLDTHAQVAQDTKLDAVGGGAATSTDGALARVEMPTFAGSSLDLVVCYKFNGYSNWVPVPHRPVGDPLGYGGRPPTAATVTLPSSGLTYSIEEGSVVLAGGTVLVHFRSVCCMERLALSSKSVASGGDEAAIVKQGELCGEVVPTAYTADLGPGDFGRLPAVRWVVEMPSVAGSYRICYKPAGLPWIAVKEMGADDGHLVVVDSGVQAFSVATGSFAALDQPSFVVGGAYLADAVTVLGTGLSPLSSGLKVVATDDTCRGDAVPGTESWVLSGGTTELRGSLTAPVWTGNYSVCFRRTAGGVWLRAATLPVVDPFLRFRWHFVTRRVTMTDEWTVSTDVAPTALPSITAAATTATSTTGADEIRLVDAASPLGCGESTTLGGVGGESSLPLYKITDGTSTYVSEGRSALLSQTSWPPTSSGFHRICYRRQEAATGSRVPAGVWMQLPQMDDYGTGFTLVPGLQTVAATTLAVSGAWSRDINDTYPLYVGDYARFDLEVRSSGGALVADHAAVYVTVSVGGTFEGSSGSCESSVAGLYGWPSEGGATHVKWGKASVYVRPLRVCASGLCDVLFTARRSHQSLGDTTLDGWTVVSVQTRVPVAAPPAAILVPDPPLRPTAHWWAETWDAEWFSVRGYAAGTSGHPNHEAAAGQLLEVAIAPHTDPTVMALIDAARCRPAAHCSGWFSRGGGGSMSAALDSAGELRIEMQFTLLRSAEATHPKGVTVMLTVTLQSDAPTPVTIPILVRPVLAQQLVLSALRPVEAESLPLWHPVGGSFDLADLTAAPGHHILADVPYTATITPQNAAGMPVSVLTGARVGFGIGWTLASDNPAVKVRFVSSAYGNLTDARFSSPRGNLQIGFQVEGVCSRASPCQLKLGVRNAPALTTTITSPVRRRATSLVFLSAPPSPLTAPPGRSLGVWVVRAVDDSGRVDSFNYGTVQPLLFTRGSVEAQLVSTGTTPAPPPGGWLPHEQFAVQLQGGVAEVSGLAIDRPCPQGSCFITFHNTWGGRVLMSDAVEVLSDVSGLACVVSPDPSSTQISTSVNVTVHVWAASTAGGNSTFPTNVVTLASGSSGFAVTDGGSSSRALRNGQTSYMVSFANACSDCTITATAPGLTADPVHSTCTVGPFTIAGAPSATSFQILRVSVNNVTQTPVAPGEQWYSVGVGSYVNVTLGAVGPGGALATSYSGSTNRAFPSLVGAELGDPTLEGTGGALSTSPSSAVRRGVAFANGTISVAVSLTQACLKCRIQFADLTASLTPGVMFLTAVPTATQLGLTSGSIPQNDTNLTRQTAFGGQASTWLPVMRLHGVDSNGAIDYLTDYTVSMRKQGGVGFQEWICDAPLYPCQDDRSEVVTVRTGKVASVADRVAAVQANNRGGALFRFAGLHPATLEDAAGARDMWGRLKWTTDTASAANAAVASYTAPFATYWNRPNSPRRLAVRSTRVELQPSGGHSISDGPGYTRTGVAPAWAYASPDAIAPRLPFPVTVQVEDYLGNPVLGVSGTVFARLMPAANGGGKLGQGSCGTGVRLGGTRTGIMSNGNITLWLSLDAACQSCRLHFSFLAAVCSTGSLCATVPDRHTTALSSVLSLRERVADEVVTETQPESVPDVVAVDGVVAVSFRTVFYVADGQVPVSQIPAAGQVLSLEAVAMPAGSRSAEQGVAGGPLRDPSGRPGVARATFGPDGRAVLELRFTRACLECSIQIRAQPPLKTAPFLLRNRAGTTFTVRAQPVRLEVWPAAGGAMLPAVRRAWPFSVAVAAVDQHGDRVDGVGFGSTAPPVRISRPRTPGGIANGGMLKHLNGNESMTESGWRTGTLAFLLAFTHPCRHCGLRLDAEPALEGTGELAAAVHAVPASLLVASSPSTLRVGDTLRVAYTAVDEDGWLARGAGGDTAVVPSAPAASVSVRLGSDAPGNPPLSPGAAGTGGAVREAAPPLIVDGRGQAQVSFTDPAASAVVVATAALPEGGVSGSYSSVTVLPNASVQLQVDGAGGAALAVVVGVPFKVRAHVVTPDGLLHADSGGRGMMLRWALVCLSAQLSASAANGTVGKAVEKGAAELNVQLSLRPGFEVAEIERAPDDCALNVTLDVPDAAPSPPWRVAETLHRQVRLLVSAAVAQRLVMSSQLTAAVVGVHVAVGLSAVDALGNVAAGASELVSLSRRGGTGCGDPQGESSVVLAEGAGQWNVTFSLVGVCVLRVQAGTLQVDADTWELRVQRRVGLAAATNVSATVVAGAWVTAAVAVVDADGAVVTADHATVVNVTAHGCGPERGLKVKTLPVASAGIAEVTFALASATSSGQSCMLLFTAPELHQASPGSELWMGPVEVTASASRLRFLHPPPSSDGVVLAVPGSHIRVTVEAVDALPGFGFPVQPNRDFRFSGIALADTSTDDDLTDLPWQAAADASGCALCGFAGPIVGGTADIWLSWHPPHAPADVQAEADAGAERAPADDDDAVSTLDGTSAPLTVRADGLWPAAGVVLFKSVAGVRRVGSAALSVASGALGTVQLETLTADQERHTGDDTTKTVLSLGAVGGVTLSSGAVSATRAGVVDATFVLSLTADAAVEVPLVFRTSALGRTLPELTVTVLVFPAAVVSPIFSAPAPLDVPAPIALTDPPTYRVHVWHDGGSQGFDAAAFATAAASSAGVAKGAVVMTRVCTVDGTVGEPSALTDCRDLTTADRRPQLQQASAPLLLAVEFGFLLQQGSGSGGLTLAEMTAAESALRAAVQDPASALSTAYSVAVRVLETVSAPAPVAAPIVEEPSPAPTPAPSPPGQQTTGTVGNGTTAPQTPVPGQVLSSAPPSVAAALVAAVPLAVIAAW